jgi:SAM-dependent methyltransferase
VVDAPTVRDDAYGDILTALHEGRPAREIIERDDGHITCWDPADYLAPYRRWPAAERRAMRFVRGRVLDVGCGAGRVSLHLQGRGHEVVAVDVSPGAVEVARRRGVRDARTAALPALAGVEGPFDTILLLRNNLAVAGGARARDRALRRITALAAPGCRIVTDAVDPDRGDDPAHRDYRPRGAAERPLVHRMRVRWRDAATPWFGYAMCAPERFAELVAPGGWRVAHLVDDGAPRYLVVLEGAAGR